MPASRNEERPVERRLLTLQEAADYLTLGVRTVKSLVAAGKIPVVRPSPRRVAIDVRDLEAYVASRRS
jgi:excisionase family DNA binding protein